MGVSRAATTMTDMSPHRHFIAIARGLGDIVQSIAGVRAFAPVLGALEQSA